MSQVGRKGGSTCVGLEHVSSIENPCLRSPKAGEARFGGASSVPPFHVRCFRLKRILFLRCALLAWVLVAHIAVAQTAQASWASYGALRRVAAPTPNLASTASGFTPTEMRRLERGKSVKRRFEMTYQGDTYQAGLSYRLVPGAPIDVIRALRQPGAIAEVIPYGVSATVLSEKDGVTVMKIAQGKRPVIGSYTVRMRWDLRNNSARFWMDPSYSADIEDIWGSFTAREVRPGLTLVSFGFAFNIRGVASILERKAQSWGLTTADRIAKYVNKTRKSAFRASR